MSLTKGMKMDEYTFNDEVEQWPEVDRARLNLCLGQMGNSLGWCLSYRHLQDLSVLPTLLESECRRIFESALAEWGELRLSRSELHPQDFVFLIVRRLADELNRLMQEAPLPWELKPVA